MFYIEEKFIKLKELFKQNIKKFVLEAAAAPEKRSGR